MVLLFHHLTSFIFNYHCFVLSLGHVFPSSETHNLCNLGSFFRADHGLPVSNLYQKLSEFPSGHSRNESD